MNQDLKSLRTQLDGKRGQQKQIKADLERTSDDVTQLERDIHFTETARSIIQKVARETQQELEYHVSELVTLALAGVFPNPYEFNVRFKEKRNKTECQMFFTRNEQRVDPMNGGGGGPLSVAHPNLRFAIWSLQKTRPTIGLDEPFHFLSRDLQPKAAETLTQISKQIKLQILMVTHSPDLIESADRVFETKITKGVTTVVKK